MDIASFFSPKSKHDRKHDMKGRLGGLKKIDTLHCDQCGEDRSRSKGRKKRPPPLQMVSGNGDMILTTMSPASIILHDVQYCSTPQTPRFFTLGNLSTTVNGYLSPHTPCTPAPRSDFLEPPNFASQLAFGCKGNSGNSSMPTSPYSACFGPPLPTPKTSFAPAELPGSILSPNYGFPPSTPTHTYSASLDESYISSPPDLTPSSGATDSDMSLFRSLTNRMQEPEDPIVNGKHVSQMNEFELWDVLQIMSEAQLKGVWGTTIQRRVHERANIMIALRVEYEAQIARFNQMNITAEHLDALITLSSSAKIITDRCNEVSKELNITFNNDRNRLRDELDAIHEVHKSHYQKLKQQYVTQIDKLVRYIESQKLATVSTDDLLTQEITSIIFEYHEAQDDTPPFEDALQDQGQKITLAADEYLGLKHEVRRLRDRETELESLILKQKEVIDENKKDIDLFKLDIKLYKGDEREKKAEYNSMKSALTRLESEKAAQANAFDQKVKELREKEESLKTASQQATTASSVTEEALSALNKKLSDKEDTIQQLNWQINLVRGRTPAEVLSAVHAQLANKETTIDLLKRKIRVLQGHTPPKSAGDCLILGYENSPSNSDQASATDAVAAKEMAALDRAFSSPQSSEYNKSRESATPESAHINKAVDSNLYSQHNLSQISTNPARWLTSSSTSQAGRTGDLNPEGSLSPRGIVSEAQRGFAPGEKPPPRRRHVSVSGAELRPAGTEYPPLPSSPALTPTSNTFRPPFDLNKELPTPPSGGFRSDMVARGSPMPRLKDTPKMAEVPRLGEVRAEERQLTPQKSFCSSASDGEHRAQQLATEFPEIVRFKIADLSDVLDEGDEGDVGMNFHPLEHRE